MHGYTQRKKGYVVGRNDSRLSACPRERAVDDRGVGDLGSYWRAAPLIQGRLLTAEDIKLTARKWALEI